MDIEQLKKAFHSCKNEDDANDLLQSCVRNDFLVTIHDTQGMIEAISPSAESFYGYSFDDVKGTSAYDYFHPSDFQTILKSHARVTIKPEVDEVEYRIRKLDNEYKKVKSFSKRISFANNREHILVLTLSRE